MSTKIFTILAIMMLLLSPLVFAQYSDGGKSEQKDDMSLDFESSCEENTLTVTGSPPISGVDVTVIEVGGGVVDSGTTDDNGEFTFQGCGMEVRIYTSKSGYKNNDMSAMLVPCEQCGEPGLEEFCGDEICQPDLQENFETCPEDCPRPDEPEEDEEEPECTSDDGCADDQYCDSPVGAAGGNCEPLPQGSCGMVANHEFVEYECGVEEDCPTCPEGNLCMDNRCEEGGIEGPGEGRLGDNVTVEVSLGNASCAGLEVRVVSPSGAVSTYITDENCEIHYVLTEEGEYQVILTHAGAPLAQMEVDSIPPTPAEGPADETPTATGEEEQEEFPWLLLLLLILVGLLLLGLVWWMMRRPKKTKKG